VEPLPVVPVPMLMSVCAIERAASKSRQQHKGAILNSCVKMNFLIKQVFRKMIGLITFQFFICFG
jgi:hypothetical protein